MVNTVAFSVDSSLQVLLTHVYPVGHNAISEHLMDGALVLPGKVEVVFPPVEHTPAEAEEKRHAEVGETLAQSA